MLLTTRRAGSGPMTSSGVSPRRAGSDLGHVGAATERRRHGQVRCLVDAPTDLRHPVEPTFQDPLHAALQGGGRYGARAASSTQLDRHFPVSTSNPTSSRSPPSAWTAGRMRSMSALRSLSRSERSSSLRARVTPGSAVPSESSSTAGRYAAEGSSDTVTHPFCRVQRPVKPP